LQADYNALQKAKQSVEQSEQSLHAVESKQSRLQAEVEQLSWQRYQYAQQSVQQIKMQLHAAEKTQQQLLAQREHTPQHGQLAAHLSAWRNAFTQLARQENTIQSSHAQQQKLTAEINQLSAQLSKQQSLYQQQEDALKPLQQVWHTEQQALEQLLEQRSVSSWQEQLNTLYGQDALYRAVLQNYTSEQVKQGAVAQRA